ncbi:15098_t:CDS:2 [Acaulospora morrowiae]|uniref:15098_t:CDS:1 n=1 Tax=Acaulospora morrowiae TaxID=94023 RepID=A0A9N8W5I3_9GLOM|nr:15098_t:CDS:2 [Acaulospora morrowiae]
MSETKPKIVIIGGGFAGINVASKLESLLHKTHQIILIERKSHFYLSIGGLRAAVEPGFEKKVFIPYDKMFKFNGKVIHATVTIIHEKEVIVSTETEFGTHIEFEYLVIATGSDYPAPAKTTAHEINEGVKHIKAQQDSIKNAKKILIIGGGPVGIELAGEIATNYTDKEITLVTSANTLLSEKFPMKLRDRLAEQLKELNVKLVMGEKIDLGSSDIGDGLSPLTLETDKGTQIESDIQFFAAGAKPNTEVVRTLNESIIEEDTHLVKVKPTFQLSHDEYGHIFAVGDVTNIHETKLAYRAGQHAEIVTKNLIALINKKKLVEYKPAPEALFVTIGKTKGAGLLPMGSMVVGSFMVKNIKGKKLFADKYWKALNATPES